ncbi:MAG: anti-sigma factor family protein [bacterium]
MWHYLLRKNFSAYLDGELDQEKSQALEVHLNGCASCQRELQEIRKGKMFTAYYEMPEWRDTKRMWQNLQSHMISVSERSIFQNDGLLLTDLFKDLLPVRPVFAAMVLAVLFVANLFIILKPQEFQYQRALVDWEPSYAFDYGLYLDALIEGVPPHEFEKRYESKKASYETAGSEITFRLASFSRLPETFHLEEMRLLKNACCRSVQFLYLKNSIPIAIFQQPKGHPITFGGYPLETFQVEGQWCHRVKAGPWKALSWEGKDSRFVAIGEMNDADMVTIILAVRNNEEGFSVDRDHSKK